jgi:pimeloyl-ACP methyl ester carboxylesterase
MESAGKPSLVCTPRQPLERSASRDLSRYAPNRRLPPLACNSRCHQQRRARANLRDRSNVIVVAQSLGGFTAPLVCERTTVRALVFVNAMIPRPGETAGAWWGNTGSAQARVGAAQAGGYSTEFDLPTYFLHDLPEEVLREAPRQREQSKIVFEELCRFKRWPNIPIRVIASADDRFFPLSFQRRVARDRLNAEVDVVSGGHLVALSNPTGLVERLLRDE